MNVFLIGLSKTGTTSLLKALNMLGYETLGDTVTDFAQLDDVSRNPQDKHCYRLTRIVREFQRVDAMFPGSKFILTTRDRNSWLKSCAHHFRAPTEPGTPQAVAREKLWGTHLFDADRFLAVYQQHLEEVQSHFRDRPDDLLVLDVIGGTGFDPLCDFLGERSLDHSFPKENVSRSFGRMIRKLKQMLTPSRGRSATST